MEEFDRFAGDYREMLDRCVGVSGEGSEYFSRYKARYVARILGPAFRGTLLDFGCGVGVLAAFIRQELPGCRLDGYDVSAASVREIPAALTATGTFTSELARLSDRYNAVVLSNVMHHVAPEHRGAVVARLRERLAPGGKLFVFEHNPANPVTRWVVARCEFDRDAILLPTTEGISRIRRAGLRLRRRDYIVFFPRALAWLRAVEPWLAWCPAGAQYVLVAERVD
ncbi:MAG: SAM-dependent methyltransferase [Candidatus Rokuibacteriota bacterium]